MSKSWFWMPWKRPTGKLMILYAIIIALIVFLVLMMIALLMSNQEKERKERLMKVVKGAGNSSKGNKLNDQNQRRAELSKKLKEKSSEEKNEKSGSLAEKIMQAGLSISVTQYWIFSVVFAVVATVAAKVLLGLSTFVVIMIAVASFLGAPKLFLKMKAAHWQKKFMEDFGDALDSMTRLLKAGMPVSEAIKMVAREYSGPVGEEMSRIFDQQKIGVPLPEAVMECAKRMPLAEVQMFATAVTIQAQTGSSLSEVLENLSKVIRARFRLKRKVQALSSEAKSSAGIIGALPVFVALGMYFMNREYIEILFIDPTGKFLLGGAIFWMFMGIIVMRQMINFKV